MVNHVACGSLFAAQANEAPEKERLTQERDVCFGQTRGPRDYSGLLSFGILLVVVGLVFLANPSIVSDFRSWIEQMRTKEAMSRPPQSLINGATLFFAFIGVSDFFMAGVRFMRDRALRRTVADVLSGIALVLFAYLAYLYGVHAISWQIVLGAEAVAIGLLVILYSVVRYMFPKRI